MEEKIIELDLSRNKPDQYTKEIQEILATVSDHHLEDKGLVKCKAMNFTVENSDIAGCHRIGKGNSETTTLRFLNRKFCNLIVDQKHELKKIEMQNYVL